MTEWKEVPDVGMSHSKRGMEYVVCNSGVNGDVTSTINYLG